MISIWISLEYAFVLIVTLLAHLHHGLVGLGSFTTNIHHVISSALLDLDILKESERDFFVTGNVVRTK